MGKTQRALTMASLVIAGESIYTLPYYLRRDYQTTMVDAMQLTNTELGQISSMFGILALISYLPGGWVADRFSARGLLTFSLITTGLGGLYISTFPGYWGLLSLHAFWGVSSILTFWAALIKATRAWGGKSEQGTAFGILDGGRGLVAAGLGSIGLALFAAAGEGEGGLHNVILLYSFTAIGAGVLTWLFIPPDVSADPTSKVQTPETQTPITDSPKPSGQLTAIFKSPLIWMTAAIIFAAYWGYWGTFGIAAFAEQGHGFTPAAAAGMSVFAVWLRPLAALGAGFVADRVNPSRVSQWAMALLVVGALGLATSPAGEAYRWLLWFNVAILAVGAYALRGVYYALLEEGKLPVALTGTGVGVVSILGYTPDILAPTLMGGLMDSMGSPGGNRAYFACIAVIAAAGVGAAFMLRRYLARQPGS